MSDDSVILQGLLERMKQGDRPARRELLDRACARVLGLHPRKVSYLWAAGTERLADHLGGAEGFR
jgi:hypothetical protein